MNNLACLLCGHVYANTICPMCKTALVSVPAKYYFITGRRMKKLGYGREANVLKQFGYTIEKLQRQRGGPTKRKKFGGIKNGK